MRLGIVCSSGGSAFFESFMAMRESVPSLPQIVVVTDRACGMEQRCVKMDVPCIRIEEKDAVRFSEKAGRVLVDQHGVDMALLYFHRILHEGLLDRVTTLNIHPALLPSFKGLSAINQTFESGVKIFGASLHVAIKEVDAGPILAQVSQPVPDKANLETLERMSFMQKASLTMLAVEALMQGRYVFDAKTSSAWIAASQQAQGSLSPALESEPYRQAFHALQERQGVPGPRLVI